MFKFLVKRLCLVVSGLDPDEVGSVTQHRKADKLLPFAAPVTLSAVEGSPTGWPPQTLFGVDSITHRNTSIPRR